MKTKNPEQPKRGPGRPTTRKMPEPLNVDPDEVARSLFNGPPKKDWRYQAKANERQPRDVE